MSLFQRITTPFGEPAEDAFGSDRRCRNAAGELLRERREQLRLDLDAVAEALCIKPVYLAAIEQGRTEELPGPTYAIGFIRAYANYLGLDGERVLDSYREETADVQTRPDLTLPVPLDERSVPGGRVLLTGLVLALCGYGAWYYVATGERERPERVAAVPAELQLLTAPAPSVRGRSRPPRSRPAPDPDLRSRQARPCRSGAASSGSPARASARLARRRKFGSDGCGAAARLAACCRAARRQRPVDAGRQRRRPSPAPAPPRTPATPRRPAAQSATRRRSAVGDARPAASISGRSPIAGSRSATPIRRSSSRAC